MNSVSTLNVLPGMKKVGTPPKNSANLFIQLNNEEIYRGELFCVNTDQKLEVPISYLEEDKNVFTFISEGGDFTFNNIDLKVKSLEGAYSTNYFNIPASQLEGIQDEEEDIFLDMVFTKKDSKEASLLINNHQINIKTNDPTFNVDISDFVISGTNVVKIVPISKLNVVSMTITVA